MGIRLYSALADTNLSAFIWSVADLLRGDYKQSDYGKVILPFTAPHHHTTAVSSSPP
jgi:hypothetical protein